MHSYPIKLYSAALVSVALIVTAAPVRAEDATSPSVSGTAFERLYDPNTGKSIALTTKTGKNGARYQVLNKCAQGETKGTGTCRSTRALTTANGKVATLTKTGIKGENAVRARLKVTGFGDRTTIKKYRKLRQP